MSGGTQYRRGEVLLVRLDPVEGSEQGGTRPVVVLSSDILNEALPVLTVAAITSRKADRIFPTEVPLTPPDGGLSKRQGPPLPGPHHRQAPRRQAPRHAQCHDAGGYRGGATAGAGPGVEQPPRTGEIIRAA